MSAAGAVVVLVCAGAEWRVVRSIYGEQGLVPVASALGERIVTTMAIDGGEQTIVFQHTGWGKIAAAAATQHVIDRFAPELLVNIGTCGGFDGDVATGDLILCERTIVYDIVERMGDQDAALAHYTTDLDLSWLADDHPPARRAVLVSADRDIDGLELAMLRERYAAIAGDWESGAIAWVAARNGVRCLILRGVSDIVRVDGGDAYDGNAHVFASGAELVMRRLVGDLATWLGASRRFAALRE